MLHKRMVLLAAAVAVAAGVWGFASPAAAQWGYGGPSGHFPGAPGVQVRVGVGAHPVQRYGYGFGGYDCFRPPIWHDTSHWDYHPGYHWRHGNHFHYQPGHYHFHRDGHWHW